MKARMKLIIVAMLWLFVLCPAASAVGDSNLVAHWQFDEGSGTIAYDSAGNNHGTIYGAQWTTGILGGALDFDGGGDRVQVPDDDSLTPSNQITICFWVYNRGGTVAAIHKYAECPDQPDSPGNSRAYGMALYEGGVSMSIFSAVHTYDHITDYNPVSVREWHHIVGTFDKGQAALYVDGLLEASATLAVSSIMNDAQPLIIGGFWQYCGTDNFLGQLNGLVDDVRIYNRALSAEEIRQIYQEAVPPEIPATYYVDGINGNDLNDGLSLETAFATVQKGINIAMDGNTVLVYPAVYSEAVDFLGKAITVQGVATAAGIPILENPGDFALSFYNGEGPDSILKKFVIRNSFMAIFIAGSSPTISNVTVVDNKYGIAAYTGAGPDISNCIFWNNTDADLYGCQARYSWVQDTKPQPLEGLISRWEFDEGSGTIAHDSVGSNHGTIHGVKWTTGILGGALDFDGDMDYVQVPDDDSLTPSNQITICFWIYNRGGQNANIYKYASCPSEPASPGNSRAYGFAVAENGTSMDIFSAVNTHDYITNYNPVSLHEWHHIAGTFNKGQAALYVDGRLGASATLAVSSIMNDAQPLIIGGVWEYCGTDSFESRWNGLADDVRIYNRALSAEEIQQLYQSGLSGGELILDPLFADPGHGDYHLRSKRGRYWPQHNVWVLDKVTSPCIDGGDPAVDPSGEPMPNGGRIDMGAFGGTPFASMSEWELKGDINHDGKVNMIDFSIFAEYWLATSLRAREIDNQLACLHNLMALGKTLMIYANDYEDEFPKADQWCDLLLQYDYGTVTEEMFVCPSAEGGPSHYAINPNAGNWSHPDMVLLFETAAGWNQFGGPELLAPENHQGRGCNILFVDGHVEFVESERLDELRWK